MSVLETKTILKWDLVLYTKKNYKNLSSNDAQFLTARHYSNSQNSIISFGYVDFQPKTFLILYPFLENSITGIAITTGGVQNEIQLESKLNTAQNS